jgi:hypothetical protein
VNRIDGRVDRVSEQIPHRRWSDQRDEEIGAGLHAIATQGVAERAQMVRNPHRNRRIQNPADTQGRVEHETGGGAARPRRPQLEHVVDGDDWLTEIDQEMVHRLADRPRG